MKQLVLSSLLLLFSTYAFSQTPQGISYQAIAFDTSGSPVTDGNVGIRISILDNAADGTAVYTETHTKLTNAQGLFNLNIGQGTADTGTFSAINWSINSKFLKVEVDPAGGTNYTITGTNQLMSVPYALYSGSTNVSNLPQSIRTRSNTSETIVIYTDTNAYGFYQNSTGGGFWSSTSISGTPIGAIASDDTIVIYTDNNAYGFYQNDTGGGFWSSTSIGGTPIGAIASNDTIVVYTDINAYGFYQNPTGGGFWSSTSIGGNGVKAVASNETIVLYTDINAYGFYQNTSGGGFWSSTSIGGTPIGAVASMNTIAIYTDINAYGFYQNPTGGGFWSSTSISGSFIDAISR